MYLLLMLNQGTSAFVVERCDPVYRVPHTGSSSPITLRPLVSVLVSRDYYLGIRLAHESCRRYLLLGVREPFGTEFRLGEVTCTVACRYGGYLC